MYDHRHLAERIAMKVSVGMTTFNGQRYVLEQLQSFVTQTRLPDELVVCDDASVDGTLGVLCEFRASAPFPVHIYVNRERLGLTSNFEQVLGLCSGDVICFSDQDDVWFENKIQRIVEIFDQTGASYVINDQILTDENLRPTGVTKFQVSSLMITGCCTAMTREFAHFCLPFPGPGQSHDGWIGGLAKYLGVRSVCDEPLQFWRRHEGSASRFQSTRVHLISTVRAIGQLRKKDVRVGFAREEERLSVFLERCSRPGDPYLTKLGGAAVKPSIDRMRHRLSSLVARRAVLEAKGMMRLWRAFEMFRCGGYRQFSGLRSLLADIAR
jgi:glycosyltransferase involved in cell wall biosynthesis